MTEQTSAAGKGDRLCMGKAGSTQEETCQHVAYKETNWCVGHLIVEFGPGGINLEDVFPALTAAPATTEPNKHEPRVRKFAGKEATCTVPGIEFVDGVCGLPEWKHTPSRMSAHRFQRTSKPATEPVRLPLDANRMATIDTDMSGSELLEIDGDGNIVPVTTGPVHDGNPLCEHCDEIIQTGDRFEIVGTGRVAHVACHDAVLAEFQPAESEADHSDEQPAGSEPV